MFLSKNPNRLLGRTLEKALQEIEKQTRREGFTIEFDVTSVSSDDFQAGVTGARVLRVLDRLSRARKTAAIHTNEVLYPGVRIKSYSENKTPQIQKQIKRELLVARAHLRRRAFDELRSAQARVESSRRAEVRREENVKRIALSDTRSKKEYEDVMHFLFVRQGLEKISDEVREEVEAAGLRALVGIVQEGKVEDFEFQFLKQLRKKLNQRLSGIIKESIELLIIPSSEELRTKIEEMADGRFPEIPKEKLEAISRRTWNVLNTLNQEAVQTILTESGTRLMEQMSKKDPKLIEEAASHVFKPIYELISEMKSDRPVRVILRIGASGEDQNFLDHLIRRLSGKEESELIVTAEVQNREHDNLRKKAQQKLLILQKEGIRVRVNFESSANESQDIKRWYISALAKGRVPVVISPERLQELMNQIDYDSNDIPRVLATSINDLMAVLAVEFFGELIDPEDTETQALMAQLLPELKERGVVITKDQGRWIAFLDKQIIERILDEIKALEAQRVAA